MEQSTQNRKKTTIEPVAANLDLLKVLQSRNVDTLRYDPVGAEFYHLFENCFNASILCVDRHLLLERKPYLVKIILEDLTNEEYNRFCKKFDSVINSEKKSYYSFNFADVLLQSEVTINYISNGKVPA